MKHTKGAMQVADAIVDALPFAPRLDGPVRRECVSVVARILDRDTGLPELLDAAKQALTALRGPQSYETEQHVAGLLEAAIRKAEEL